MTQNLDILDIRALRAARRAVRVEQTWPPAIRAVFDGPGLREDEIIAPEYEGFPLSRTAQVRMVGKSVPPQMAETVTAAQFGVGPTEARMTA